MVYFQVFTSFLNFKRVPMLKCAVISLGCPKNLVDSEQMLGLLQQHSVSPCLEVEEADIVIVNTCGFLAASREEALENIREMETLRMDPNSPLRCLIAAGCLVTRDKEELIASCPKVDAFLDVFSRDSVLEAVGKIFPEILSPILRENVSRDSNFKLISEKQEDNSVENDHSFEKLLPQSIKGTADLNSKICLPGNNSENYSLPVFEKTEPIGETYYEKMSGIASDPHRFPLLPPHIAYLKIAEGCDRRCAFCAIPNIRGRFRSKPTREILEEARRLAAQGVKEVILIAQETSRYGIDLRNSDGTRTEDTLANLLRLLNEIDGIRWIRVQYLYPQDFSEELVSAFAETPKVVPYVDMPLQHINDRILRAMRRSAGREETIALLTRLRERIPELVIRTAFIAGFPGETKAEFEELLAFLRKQKFERVAVFQFSPEEGTPAAEMEKQVPEKISLKRTNDLILTQKRISAEWTRKQLGKTMEVLLDAETEEEGVFLGHSPFSAPDIDRVVYVSADEGFPETLEVGEFYLCEIVDCDEYDLYAVPLKKINE